ncbi:MAG: response regulator [Chthoniobacteraceae bacterium]
MKAVSSTAHDPLAARTRVLVAEDDEKTRTALVFLLQRHRFDVTVAIDGKEALEALITSNPPQIALLDWEMPHLDGLHVCRAVRTLPKDHFRYTYVVMVTARDQANDLLAAFEAGVDDFLSKPVDAAQLLARLRCGERVLNLEERCQQRISDLEKALDEVRQLKRLLPICMYCKKVRDDGDYWQEIDAYIHTQTGTDFSHGICPSCMELALKRDLPGDPVERVARSGRNDA